MAELHDSSCRFQICATELYFIVMLPKLKKLVFEV